MRKISAFVVRTLEVLRPLNAGRVFESVDKTFYGDTLSKNGFKDRIIAENTGIQAQISIQLNVSEAPIL